MSQDKSISMSGSGGITVGTGGISSSSGNLEITAFSNNTIDLNSDVVVASGKKITSAYVPILGSDVANKAYVDSRGSDGGSPLLFYLTQEQNANSVLTQTVFDAVEGTGLSLTSGAKTLTTATTPLYTPGLSLHAGTYTLSMYARVSATGPSALFSFSMFKVDADGTSNKTPIRSSGGSGVINSINLSIVTCSLSLPYAEELTSEQRLVIDIEYLPITTNATRTLLVSYGNGGSYFTTPPIPVGYIYKLPVSLSLLNLSSTSSLITPTVFYTPISISNFSVGVWLVQGALGIKLVSDTSFRFRCDVLYNDIIVNSLTYSEGTWGESNFTVYHPTISTVITSDGTKPLIIKYMVRYSSGPLAFASLNNSTSYWTATLIAS
jgi:hypothetical protein